MPSLGTVDKLLFPVPVSDKLWLAIDLICIGPKSVVSYLSSDTTFIDEACCPPEDNAV